MSRVLPRKKAKGRKQIAVDREIKTNLSLPASELGGSNEQLLLSCRHGNRYWRQSLVRQHRCPGDAATATTTNQRSNDGADPVHLIADRSEKSELRYASTSANCRQQEAAVHQRRPDDDRKTEYQQRHLGQDGRRHRKGSS